MQKKLSLKMLIIIGLCLLMLVPLAMIHAQIRDRSDRQKDVTLEVAQASAGQQVIIGPVVLVRWRTRDMPASERDSPYTFSPRIVEHSKIFPAASLFVTGNSTVEKRHRGIYSANLFHADLELNATLTVPPWLGAEQQQDNLVEAPKAWLLMGISDLRGLNNSPQALINGNTFRIDTLSPGEDETLGGKNIGFALGAFPLEQGASWNLSLPLQLTGTDALALAPTAQETMMDLTSTWPHPSFGGRFLPLTHDITNGGFSARWQVSHLARDFEAARKGREIMSVNFIEPVNIYLKAERAVKYGQLFIVLTFSAFFLLEIIRRTPIHPLQYAMVGMALVIFFLLLIALSEHLAFALAYAISALGCISIIGIYLSGALKSRRAAAAFSGGLAMLYAILYGLLLNEDSALLMGSLLLFATLGGIMLLTRNINWYAVGDDIRDTALPRRRSSASRESFTA